jgi:catechol 2,3-dioxygenase-like lactoylglutathione lyase family enzyme
MIKHVGIVSIKVSDQDRAKEFYVDKLGLECLAEAPRGESGRWVQVVPKGPDTSLTLVTWFENMRPGGISGLEFEVDDIEAEYATLISRGVPFEGPPSTHSWGTFASFTDADENRLIFSRQP